MNQNTYSNILHELIKKSSHVIYENLSLVNDKSNISDGSQIQTESQTANNLDYLTIKGKDGTKIKLSYLNKYGSDGVLHFFIEFNDEILVYTPRFKKANMTARVPIIKKVLIKNSGTVTTELEINLTTKNDNHRKVHKPTIKQNDINKMLSRLKTNKEEVEFGSGISTAIFTLRETIKLNTKPEQDEEKSDQEAQDDASDKKVQELEKIPVEFKYKSSSSIEGKYKPQETLVGINGEKIAFTNWNSKNDSSFGLIKETSKNETPQELKRFNFELKIPKRNTRGALITDFKTTVGHGYDKNQFFLNFYLPEEAKTKLTHRTYIRVYGFSIDDLIMAYDATGKTRGKSYKIKGTYKSYETNMFGRDGKDKKYPVELKIIYQEKISNKEKQKNVKYDRANPKKYPQKYVNRYFEIMYGEDLKENKINADELLLEKSTPKSEREELAVIPYWSNPPGIWRLANVNSDKVTSEDIKFAAKKDSNPRNRKRLAKITSAQAEAAAKRQVDKEKKDPDVVNRTPVSASKVTIKKGKKIKRVINLEDSSSLHRYKKIRKNSYQRAMTHLKNRPDNKNLFSQPEPKEELPVTYKTYDSNLNTFYLTTDKEAFENAIDSELRAEIKHLNNIELEKPEKLRGGSGGFRQPFIKDGKLTNRGKNYLEQGKKTFTRDFERKRNKYMKAYKRESELEVDPPIKIVKVIDEPPTSSYDPKFRIINFKYPLPQGLKYYTGGKNKERLSQPKDYKLAKKYMSTETFKRILNDYIGSNNYNPKKQIILSEKDYNQSFGFICTLIGAIPKDKFNKIIKIEISDVKSKKQKSDSLKTFYLITEKTGVPPISKEESENPKIFAKDLKNFLRKTGRSIKEAGIYIAAFITNSDMNSGRGPERDYVLRQIGLSKEIGDAVKKDTSDNKKEETGQNNKGAKKENFEIDNKNLRKLIREAFLSGASS